MLIGQQRAALVSQAAAVDLDIRRFDALLRALGVLIVQLQRVKYGVRAAADKPGGVIYRALRARQQQIADALDLPAAVIQMRGIEAGCLFADHAPAIAVIQLAALQRKVALRAQRTGLIVEIAALQAQIAQAVERAVFVVDVLTVAVNKHATALQQACPVIECGLCGEAELVLRYQRTSRII